MKGRSVIWCGVILKVQAINTVAGGLSLIRSGSADVETWAVSPRGAGWLFGDKVATEVRFLIPFTPPFTQADTTPV